MSTESGKVSLKEKEEDECLPLVLDRTVASLETDFCKESEILVTQKSQV